MTRFPIFRPDTRGLQLGSKQQIGFSRGNGEREGKLVAGIGKEEAANSKWDKGQAGDGGKEMVRYGEKGEKDDEEEEEEDEEEDEEEEDDEEEEEE